MRREPNAGIVSRFGSEFIRFFLRLLNGGVAVAVVGNPLAFDQLKSSAQDEARLTAFGWHNFAPVVDETSDEWREDLVPGIWKQAQLLNEPDEPIEDLDLLLLRESGGIARYLARLRMETLKLGLQNGHQRVTRDLILEAVRTKPMEGVSRQIVALRERDVAALSAWGDLPEDFARGLWGMAPAKGSDGGLSNRSVTATRDKKSAPAPKRAGSKPAQKRMGRSRSRADGAARAGYLSDEFKARLVADLARNELKKNS